MSAERAADGCQVHRDANDQVVGHVKRSIKGGWVWHMTNEAARSLPLPSRRVCVVAITTVTEQRAALLAALPDDPGEKTPFANLSAGDVAMVPRVARVASDGVFRVFERRRVTVASVDVEWDGAGRPSALITEREESGALNPILMTAAWYGFGAVLVRAS